ncbi:MAG TPA: hypothetical protein VL948_09740 [Verrucomicrobiae bacterium]|jgi:hypothetical protein|nr:hypothetical protein [Verrucomicrobiae bacterium]
MRMWRGRTAGVVALMVVALTAMAVGSVGAADQTSGPFAGKAVNGGTVTVTQQGSTTTLTLSPDFQVPGSPDPHWQVVDTRGTVYLLDRLKLKDDRIKTSITVPGYVPSIAKVQIWCAWAEVVLGETAFASPVMAAK